MSEWREITLGESLELLIDNRGKNPPYVGDGVPAVSGQNVSARGYLDLSTARMVSTPTWEKWMPHPTRQGDIVMTSEAPLGRVARVPSDDRIALTQRVFGLRGAEHVLDTGFLFYALQTDFVRAELEGRATGTTVVGIRQPALRAVRLMAPNVKEQQAIAEVLGALDDKISANTALASRAEDLLRTEIDAEWLSHPSRDALLSDFVDLNPFTPSPRDSEPLYVDMKKLPESGWSIDAPDRREAKGGARFNRGDTLLARITPCLENRKTGYVDNIPDGDTAIGSTEFIVLRARAGVAPPIGFLVATESRFREFAIQNMVGTSGRQRVAASDLARFEMPQPDAEWLAQFGARASALFAQVESLQAENRTLAATRDALLRQLMSGKLRVRDAEAAASAAGA